MGIGQLRFQADGILWIDFTVVSAYTWHFYLSMLCTIKKFRKMVSAKNFLQLTFIVSDGEVLLKITIRHKRLNNLHFSLLQQEKLIGLMRVQVFHPDATVEDGSSSAIVYTLKALL